MSSHELQDLSWLMPLDILFIVRVGALGGVVLAPKVGKALFRSPQASVKKAFPFFGPGWESCENC